MLAAAPAVTETSDLAVLDDDDGQIQSLPRDLDARQQRSARLAALDPDDGIAL